MHCASVYMHIKLGISYSLYAYKRQKIALVIPLCIYLRSYGRTYNLLTNGPDDLTNLGLHARGASKSQHNTTQLINCQYRIVNISNTYAAGWFNSQSIKGTLFEIYRIVYRKASLAHGSLHTCLFEYYA